MLNLDTHMVIHGLAGDLRPAEQRLLAGSSWAISAIVHWELEMLFRLGQSGVQVYVAEYLRPWLPAEERHRGPGRDVDEPAKRQHYPDHDPEQDARRQYAEYGGQGDPEVEPRDPAHPTELRDVDHPEHDGVDDDRAEHSLRQLREERREEDQCQDDERPGRERGERRSRAR